MKIQIDLEDSEKRISFIETECKHFEAPLCRETIYIRYSFRKPYVEAIFAIKI